MKHPTKGVETPKRTALRQARQRIAAGAAPFGSRDFTSTRTRVLPLADPVSDSVWAIARDAALALRGFGRGSLADLVIGLHADGWRLFGSGSERDAFLLGAKFNPATFDAAVAADVGHLFPKWTAASLRAVLTASPRKVGAQANPTLLAARLSKALGVKASQLDAPPQLVLDIAAALADAFPTWRDIAAVDGQVGEVIDRVITDAGYRWPSLAAGWSVDLPAVPEALGVPTLALDLAAVPVIEPDQTARFAGIVARYLPEAGGLQDPGIAKGVQARITTPNGNGFSWLFGVGRRALLGQVPRDEALIALNACSPRGERSFDAIVAALSRLPDLSSMGERVYPGARSSLQGSIDSLIAHYINRLVELDAAATALAAQPMARPSMLDEIEWHEALFEGMPFTPGDIAALFSARAAEIARVRAALDVLMGVSPATEGGYGRAIEDVEAFGGWADRLESVASELNARINASKAPAKLLLRGPLGGGRWKALVTLTLPEGPPADVIPELDATLKSLLGHSQAAFDGMVQAYQPTLVRALAHMRCEVRTGIRIRSGDRPSIDDDAIDQLARRKLLDYVARVTRRSSNAMGHAFLAACAAQGLTRPGAATERSLRGHILSGEQVLYAHPLARRRSIVRLERDALRTMNLDAILLAMREDVIERGDVREQLLLQFVRESLYLVGLPDRLALSDLPWATAAGAKSASRLAPWANLRPAADGTVARSEVIKAYTARFHSAANGLLYRLNRMRFVERYDIRCFVGSTLLFVPSEGGWTPPPQYGHGKFARWLNDVEMPRTAKGDVDVRPAAKWLAKASAGTAPEMRAAAVSLMSQFPHKWVVACDFEGAESHEGVFPSDGEISGWIKRRGYRLSVPRHFAGELLAGFRGASISPHGLTFERHMERDGTAVTEISRRVTAAFPIEQAIAPSTQRWTPRHLMGLDLGEAGLGVCLRHLETGAETTLLLPVRKTRLLARQQEHYRRRLQPRQSFRKGYSDTTELAVKAAIGEVCSLVDNLIVRFDAVPVFESSVAQARGSNKMVQRVFGGILQRYAFVANSGVAQAMRQGHWFGASRWQYAFGADVLPAARAMTAEQLGKAKAEAVFRPALGYPGVVVSGYRTSLICACCGEDALAALDAAIENGQVSFTTDMEGRGVLHLPGRDVTLQLETPSPNVATHRAARLRKRRAPWEVLGSRTWLLTRKGERADLVSTIRRGLRRPPHSTQGHRTSGWEFHCPACSAVAQADVNAARNLVRRYQERVTNAGELMVNWGDVESRRGFIQSISKM